MTKYFTNNFSVLNLHKKPSTRSEVITQMLYGDSFSVSKKNRKWLRVKIKEDNYRGYVQNKNFSNFKENLSQVLVDKIIRDFLNKDVDYVSNVDPPSFPDGMDVEVIDRNCLENNYSSDLNKYHLDYQKMEHPHMCQSIYLAA